MNPAESLLLDGYMVLREQFGRLVTTNLDSVTPITVTIEDAIQLAEPAAVAQARGPEYVNVRALETDITTPASVTTFTEVETGKWHKVLRYDGTTYHGVYSWFCEAQR